VKGFRREFFRPPRGAFVWSKHCPPQQGRVLLEMYPAPSTDASILVLLLAGRAALAALAIVARVLFSYWLLVPGF